MTDVPRFDELYDEADLERMAKAGRRAVEPRHERGQRIAGGALVAAIGLGMREVFDPAVQEPVIEEVDPTDRLRDEPIVIVGMEAGPRHTRALVRPWLFASAAR